jgi:hypothetical protein
MKALEQLLESFGKRTVKQARSNLTRLKKRDTNGIYDSLDYSIVKRAEGDWTIEFSMVEYGEFVDEGVSGTKNKYSTPNQFKKQPPIKAILPWVKRKGLRLRDDNGKFKKGTQKTLSFLIARSIKENGLKPTKFFTKPFENEFNKLPDEVLENFLKDFFINKV